MLPENLTPMTSPHCIHGDDTSDTVVGRSLGSAFPGKSPGGRGRPRGPVAGGAQLLIARHAIPSWGQVWDKIPQMAQAKNDSQSSRGSLGRMS